LFVTKTYLPSKKKFLKYIDKIWDTHILTNNGELVLSLEDRLKLYSQSSEVLACANGTIVLQMAIKAMNITKEVITTPFTYVATTNALLWEGCQPVFVDIEPGSFTIDVTKIENAITDNTEAILATHVYGYPCNIEAIEKIVLRHNLKVIYDASNAFGTKYKGKSIFTFGDISACSLHATKLFHTAEGGALFINNPDYYKQLYLYRAFGHIYDDYFTVGINAKMSELHAAIGLCVFDDLDKIIRKRKKVSYWYNEYLDKPGHNPPIDLTLTEYNFAYYPVLFQSQKQLLGVKNELESAGVFPRRYFYPSLNRLPFITKANSCPVSEDISARIMCLPLSHYINQREVKNICAIINRKVKELC
jgi:dTDP-4-amino-4,6-dideoxygalactose transaminase